MASHSAEAPTRRDFIVIAAQAFAGVGAQVVVFTPTAPLAPNATYSATIDGIRDVAGNFAEGLPLATSFADWIGTTPGQRALDVGCGPGALTTVLADRLGVAEIVVLLDETVEQWLLTGSSHLVDRQIADLLQ